MNGLQVVDSWDTFYHHPRSVLLGVMSAIYFAGAVCSLPFVPIVADGLGRRWSITTGSLIMIVGAILQGASQNCKNIWSSMIYHHLIFAD
jgi:MFS family permease